MDSLLSRKTSAALLISTLAAFTTLPAFASERKVEHRVQPIYPELAKRMHVGGTVHVEATVAADGSVIQAKTMNGNKMLAPAAEDAIRKWKFVPEGAPSTENVDIDFELSE